MEPLGCQTSSEHRIGKPVLEITSNICCAKATSLSDFNVNAFLYKSEMCHKLCIGGLLQNKQHNKQDLTICNSFASRLDCNDLTSFSSALILLCEILDITT